MLEAGGVCEALIQSALERQHIGLLSQGYAGGFIKK